MQEKKNAQSRNLTKLEVFLFPLQYLLYILWHISQIHQPVTREISYFKTF